MIYLFHKLTDYLYLLQLENYNLPRFFQGLHFSLKPINRRQKLIWTKKAVTLFSLSLALLIIFLILLIFLIVRYTSWHFLVTALFITLSIYIFSLLFFLFLSLANLILFPLDWALKSILITKAKRHLKKFPDLKIIGLTGSYGKTTCKEMLFSVLNQKYETIKTPENINTPLGVARLILKNINASTKIFIVEMGAYQIGDIKKLCSLTRPDISILTGINESHLARFGSLTNTIKAKFEIVAGTKPNGSVILNLSDKNIKDNYLKFSENKTILPSTIYRIEEQKILPDAAGQTFILEGQNKKLGPFRVKHIAPYISLTAILVILVAQKLGLTEEDIKAGLSLNRPAPHRLAATLHANGILVIDDSYNGNPAGVKAAIKTLALFKDRRKIFVTPGLVEMGHASQDIHLAIGRYLASVANEVILIKNSVTPFIKDGLKENDFSPDHIHEYNSMPDFERILPRFIKRGDVILFQNDWPDNYK